MGFFTQKWKHENEEVRMQWIENVNSNSKKNIGILTNIAINDTDRQVGEKAAQKLSDNNALFNVAMKAKSSIADIAIDRISDQNILSEVVLKQKKQRALYNIIDEEILKDIESKLDARYDDVLVGIIKSKLQCPELYIAKKEGSYEKLIEIAETHQSAEVKLESLKHFPVTDSETLVNRLIKIIDSNSDNYLVQKEATICIGNKCEDVLIDLAKNSNSSTVREAALLKLEPRLDLYEYIAENENDITVLKALIACLSTFSYRKHLANDHGAVGIIKDLFLSIYKKTDLLYAPYIIDVIISKEHLYDRRILMKMGKHSENKILNEKVMGKLLTELNIESTEKNCSSCKQKVSKFSMAGENCPHCNAHWSDELWD